MTQPTSVFGGGFVPGLRVLTDDLDASFDFLASEHYILKRGGITLDAALVPADANGDKILRGGTLLGKVTATSRYGPYDNALIDGRQDAKGVLFAGDLNLRWGATMLTGLLIHGSVLQARCTGYDAAAAADLAGRVIFQ